MNIESKIAKITAERDECRAKSKKYFRAKATTRANKGLYSRSSLSPYRLNREIAST